MTATRKFYRIAFKICPLLSIAFSLTVLFITIYIENEVSPLLFYLSAQVYLNWFAVYNVSKRAVPPILMSNQSRFTHELSSKFWYCDRCQQYTQSPTQHCHWCNKCFRYRDHHCFFLGACVLQQNIGNFLLVCLHASLASLYSACVIGSYLNEHLSYSDNVKSSVYYLVLNFCFPIAIARFLLLEEETSIVFFVTIFDILVSVTCLSFSYCLWKLYACLKGKQRYYPYIPKRQKLHEIFGNYGLLNIFFPLNGIVFRKSSTEQFEMKNV